MKLSTILTFLCLYSQFLSAQKNPELIHSGKVIEKGIEAYDQGNYEEALMHFEKVHPSDTNYLTALYETSLTLIALERYNECISVCQESIDKGYHYPEIYNTYGTALDYQEKRSEALRVYDKGLKHFPYSMTLLFNKAVVFESMEDREKSVEAFQELVSLNPFHASSHLHLGIIAAQEGESTQALMSMVTYLILEPGSGRSLNVLQYADNVAAAEAEDIGSNDHQVVKPEFSELDLIIKNRIALNEKYETPSDLTFPIIKQTYLIMERLDEKKKKDKGFWASYYAPLLSWIKKENYFEEMALLISASVESEDLQKMISRDIDKIKEFRMAFLGKMREIHGTHTIEYNGEELEVQKWFNEDFSLKSMGAVDKQGNNDGPWFFYFPTGQLDTEGQYDKGKKTGKWISYTLEGDTLSIHNLKNNELNGPYSLFYENGEIQETGHYNENGNVDGELKGYYDTGQLKLVIYFEDGVRTGKNTYYYKSGSKSQEFQMKDGKLEGPFIDYYANGQISEESTYVAGEQNGQAKIYYPDGGLQREVNFVNGILEGPYKEYYDNGQLEREGIAAKGAVAGNWKYYYKDGSLSKVTDYSENGKINGESISYDYEERPYEIAEYKKGDLQGIRILDEKGKEIYSARESKNQLDVKFYNYRRDLVSEGAYVEGKLDGKWAYFDDSGFKYKTQDFKMDELNGEEISYHKNGLVNYIMNYEEGDAEGYSYSNYANGNIYTEGNYSAGLKECLWYTYYSDGTIEDEDWYEKGDLKGDAMAFAVNGKLYTKTVFEEAGLLTAFVKYDTSGIVLDSVYLQNGNGLISIKGVSGEKYFVANYIGGLAHGDFLWYYPNGQLETKGQYNNGRRAGEWNYYHPNGQLSEKGSYLEGDRHGKWVEYYYDGNLKSEKHYHLGVAHGSFAYYYIFGGERKVFEYYDGEEHGSTRFYSPEGDLLIERVYDHGKMIGYTYLDADGKLKPMIPIENETAVITAYHPNGNIAAKYEIDKGWFVGPYKLYYKNGDILKDVNYVNDLQEGADITYFKDGKIALKDNAIQGELHGTYESYYPNGQQRSRQEYYLDKLHGPSVFYDQNGNEIESIEYYNNEVLKM